MKRHLLLIILLFFLLPLRINAQALIPNIGVVCANGQIGGQVPFIGVPTYDYGPNGLVRFHFMMNPTGWGGNLFYSIYDSNCNLLTSYGTGYNTGNIIPAGVSRLVFQAVPTDTSHYNFNAYDEDTGTQIPLTGEPIPFSAPVISINFSNYVFNGFFGVLTPAVPVINPNFRAQKPPILIVPGILGTEIEKGDTPLWINSKMYDPFNSDSFMDPMQFKADLTPLDYSLSAPEVIKGVDPLGKFKEYDYTNGLINEFTNQGYSEEQNLFTFPYDWRYGVTDDIVGQLQKKIQSIMLETGSSKVDVVAHSTGGLIVKKYIMENPNSNYIGKAIFIGVPNLGAPKAFKVLLNGDNFDIPGLDGQEMKKIAQNMPVAYDLAPSQQYYDQIGSFLHVSDPYISLVDPGKDLNYSQSIQEFENQNLINDQAIDDSENLHTKDFDNFDVRTAGVDAYNIIGCKTGTFGRFTEIVQSPVAAVYDLPKDTSGDGTVPLLSAQTIPADSDKVFFAPKADHGKMPSEDGIRQEIVNLITGSNLDTGGKILTKVQVQENPKLCEIKGESINIKSPLAIGVADQDGNFSGIAADGSIQNDIPGADYEVWGEHKYVFLPTDNNQQYQIDLAGTGNGTFTLNDQSIDGDTVTQTQVFSNLAVTTKVTGQVKLGNVDELVLDTNSDGIIDATISPSSVIDQNQSQDTAPPVSTSTASGTMGQPGFYRSNVSIRLSAIDPVINNNPAQTSGVFQIYYKLDNDPSYSSYTAPLNLSSEGVHTLSFFSSDKAGNNENPQSLSFVIDKTPPELTIQFSPTLQDLQFSGTDTLPTLLTASTSTSSVLSAKKLLASMFAPKVVDQDSTITVTDAAGNTTQLILQGSGRKHAMKADIKSLAYNGVAQDLSKTLFHFDWSFDKKGNLQALTQQIQSKKNFSISAVYALLTTFIIGKDQAGVVSKALIGLNLLKVSTSKGDLLWNY